MRSYLLALSLVLFSAVPLSAARAQEQTPTVSNTSLPHSHYGVGHFGLGLMLGDPTGVVGKVRFNELVGLDFMAGYGFYGGGHFHTHLDVLFQFNIHKWNVGALDWYFGVGPQFGFFHDSPWARRDEGPWVGGRIPGGVSWFFARAPFDLFFEVAPGMWFFQEPAFDINVSTGARVWF